jgi:hypothetical protein
MKWIEKIIYYMKFWTSNPNPWAKSNKKQSSILTSKKEKTMIENLPIDELTDYLLEKGSKIIEKEIKAGVKTIMELDKNPRYRLKPTELLSDHVVLNKDLPSNVKSKILKVKENINALVHGIASEIEEHHFKTAEELVTQSSWMTEQKDKVWTIIQGQKKVNYSFRTLEVTLDVFKRYNNRLLQEIQTVEDEEQNFKLKIENALLVYEIFDVTIQHACVLVN